MNNILGYKPHLSAEILGITKETLRYWKTHLDPNPRRTHFSANTLLAYRVIKALIEDLRFTPSHLKKYDLSLLFDFARDNDLETVENYKILLAADGSSLSFHHEDAPFDMHNRKIAILYLSDLVKEHLNSFTTI